MEGRAVGVGCDASYQKHLGSEAHTQVYTGNMLRQQLLENEKNARNHKAMLDAQDAMRL